MMPTDKKTQLILQSKQNYWNQRMGTPRIACIVLSSLNLYYNIIQALPATPDEKRFWTNSIGGIIAIVQLSLTVPSLKWDSCIWMVRYGYMLCTLR